MDKSIDTVIGIDVGLDGGIAYYKRGGSCDAIAMPTRTEQLRTKTRRVTDVRSVFDYINQVKGENTLIMIEKVSAWTGDVDEEGKVFRIIKMVANYEKLIATIEITGIPYVEVRPQDWQNHLALAIKGMPKPDRKKLYKEFAISKFPDLKVTNKTADALCILFFGCVRVRNEFYWIEERLKNVQNQGKV